MVVIVVEHVCDQNARTEGKQSAHHGLAGTDTRVAGRAGGCGRSRGRRVDLCWLVLRHVHHFGVGRLDHDHFFFLLHGLLHRYLRR